MKYKKDLNSKLLSQVNVIKEKKVNIYKEILS